MTVGGIAAVRVSTRSRAATHRGLGLVQGDVVGTLDGQLPGSVDVTG
jgi:hypothetical protein